MSKRVNGVTNSKVPAKEKKPKITKSAYKLPDKMPEGTLLVDLKKKTWKLGKPIGSGGFGLIYLATEQGATFSGDNGECVLKIEPSDNGPLFCELHFYQRAAQTEMINDWMKAKLLKFLGIPRFIASGINDLNGKKYRFMVMERCGCDIQKIFEQNKKRFPTHTVFQLGLKMLDALEYMHAKKYAHADIKASNILQGYNNPSQVYLIDFGLAFRFEVEGKHKEYKEDPRKAHDGTVEFTSRDAHNGVSPSRRGDLEILGYCMLQWLCGQLPWEDDLVNKNRVRDLKTKYMKNIPELLKTCFPTRNLPAELSTYLQYVASLTYEAEPSYVKCRQMFSAAIKKLGYKDNDPLDFSLSASPESPSKVIGKKRKSDVLLDNTNDDIPIPTKSPRAASSKPRKAAKKSSSNMEVVEDTENCEDPTGMSSSAVGTALDLAPAKRLWPKAKITPSTDSLSVDTPSKSSLRTKKSPKTAVIEKRSPVDIAAAKKAADKSLPGIKPVAKSKSTTIVAVVKQKRKNAGITTGTQTSPGLPGLPRSSSSARNKRAKTSTE